MVGTNSSKYAKKQSKIWFDHTRTTIGWKRALLSSNDDSFCFEYKAVQNLFAHQNVFIWFWIWYAAAIEGTCFSPTQRPPIAEALDNLQRQSNPLWLESAIQHHWTIREITRNDFGSRLKEVTSVLPQQLIGVTRMHSRFSKRYALSGQSPWNSFPSISLCPIQLTCRCSSCVGCCRSL